MGRKILIVGDPHLRPQELEFGRILLMMVLNQIMTSKPDYVVLMGDIFHFKDRLSGICLKIFNDFLIEASQHTKIILLVGNHDWCKPYTVHALDGYRGMSNVTVVDDFYRLDDENIFVSYCREKERFEDLLQKAGPAKRLFGHLDINSFKVGSGWEEVEAFCDPEFFSDHKFNQVFSGHLHLAQERQVKNCQIVFVGTGYTTDFGETDQYKRLLMLDLDDGSFEDIPTNLTFHKTLKVNAGEPFPEIPVEDLERGVEFRLIIRGTKEQIAILQKPKNYPAKYVYDWVLNEGARIDLSVTDTQEDTMKKYIKEEIKRSFGNDATFDQEKLFKIGNRFLNSVK